MTPLRLLADDLTGALDSAAAFGSPAAPVVVRWRGPVPATGSLAFDSRTREAGEAEALGAMRALVPQMWAGAAGLAYKKVDSLLRGHEAMEIAAAIDLLRPRHCIVAPAFPFQRRITRGGRQMARDDGNDGDWRVLAADLAADLAARGHETVRASPGEAIPDGVSLFDAETDADLDAVVAAAAGLTGVLWVGSGGLAAALARSTRGRPDETTVAVLPRPVLGLFGSDHPALRAQLAHSGARHRAIGGTQQPDDVARLIAGEEVALLSVDLPDGTPRTEAAARIDAVLAGLVRRLPRPGTLVVAGGETLRGLCEALGATELAVTGEMMPGVPRSTLRGGVWDGVTVVSKSGAFGPPDLLNQLFPAAAASSETRAAGSAPRQGAPA